MEPRLVNIGEAARMLGTKPDALRRWERTGELLPTRRTRVGTRYYSVSDLLGTAHEAAPTLCHARVSSQDREADLDRPQTALEAYCATKGWHAETIRAPGSGLPYRKQGLQRLLDPVLKRQIWRLEITHKDRLLRFGAELVLALCERQGIGIVIIHQGEPPAFEEELAQDVLEIITVFRARLYGSRSHPSRQLIDSLKAASKS
jgi:predicted site-specific integrase-resolvase